MTGNELDLQIAELKRILVSKPGTDVSRRFTEVSVHWSSSSYEVIIGFVELTLTGRGSSIKLAVEDAFLRGRNQGYDIIKG